MALLQINSLYVFVTHTMCMCIYIYIYCECVCVCVLCVKTIPNKLYASIFIIIQYII